MNRVLLVSIFAILSISPAFAADGRGHGGGWQRGGGHGGGWNGGWIGPALVGGAIIDDMAQPELVYIQQPTPVYATSIAPQVVVQYWYYCAAAKAYYPYVSSCPSGWQTVPATPPVVSPTVPKASVPAPVSKTLFSDKPITIKGANFARGSAELQPAAYEQLDAAVEFAAKNEDATLTVAGYTDSRGNEKENQILSAQRAESVKAYLVKQGVDADRIITAGKGSADPVGDNSTPQGRAENRRVEINFVERATR